MEVLHVLVPFVSLNLRRFSTTEITKEEENYEEAVKAVNSCFGGGKPNATLCDILNDPACTQLNKNVLEPDFIVRVRPTKLPGLISILVSLFAVERFLDSGPIG